MFKKNTAVTGFTFGLVSSSDGSDITTGTPVGFFTLDGGSQTAIADVSPVHEGNGQWSFDLTAAEMNGDIVGLVFTHASAITVHFTIKTDTRLVSELNDFDPAVDVVALVTDLTNLPSIPANWLTAAGIAANALDGKGNWNIGKTGYSLLQAFPTNFADMFISVTTGLVDISQGAADKVWSSATRNLTALGFVLAAADFGAASLNGKGDWNVGKTGYSISGTKTTLDALNDLTIAQVKAEADSALSDIFLDRLFAVNYDPASKPGSATALLNELVEDDAGVSRFTSNALEQVLAATLAELSSIPPAAPTVGQALMLPFMAIRNKRDTTAGSDELHNSAGTVIATAVVSDDATTFTKGKYA